MERSIHGPTGIHAHKDATNNWEWMAQDGLGSVRGVVDNSAGVLWSGNYDPFGTGYGVTGTPQTPYGFTGELTDSNGLLHLRARYLNPSIGTFLSLDPFEGTIQRPMSLNVYSWVEGNVPNATDASGRCPLRPDPLDVVGHRCTWLARELHIKHGWPSLCAIMEMLLPNRQSSGESSKMRYSGLGFGLIHEPIDGTQHIDR